MATKRKGVIYAEKPFISRAAKAELKPIVYIAAIGVPVLVLMWALGRERQ